MKVATFKTFRISNTKHKKKPLKIPLGAVVDLLVKIGALGLLFYWCYNILEPFITIALWSVILAVSLFPVYSRLKNGFGKRDKLAAGLITGILMLILIAPPVWMLVASGSELKTFADHLKGGTLTLPLPGEELKTFPVIGPIFLNFGWRG